MIGAVKPALLHENNIIMARWDMGRFVPTSLFSKAKDNTHEQQTHRAVCIS